MISWRQLQIQAQGLRTRAAARSPKAIQFQNPADGDAVMLFCADYRPARKDGQ